MTKPKSNMVRPKWDDFPVHPAADTLPMSSEAEIKTWSKDIERNGLQHQFIVFEDNTEEANGADGPFPRYLLDGRGRREACKMLGVDNPYDAPKGNIVGSTVRVVKAVQRVGLTEDGTGWEVDVDPYSFVLSMNVHRRHLTVEQKRQVIEDHLKAMPHASDREIGRKVGVSHPTVADVRKEVADRNGNSFQNERQSPIDRVKAILIADPTLSDGAAATQAEVAKSTANKARHELIEAGTISPRENPRARSVPKAKPEAEPPKPKPTDEERAAARKAAKITDDIGALAVFAQDLRTAIKAVAKHTLTGEQAEVVRALASDTIGDLRILL